MQMKTNKNGVKLLAAIMVFAMAFAGIAVVASDVIDADGNEPITNEPITTSEDLINAAKTENSEITLGSNIRLEVDMVLASGVTINAGGYIIETAGHDICAAEGVTKTPKMIGTAARVVDISSGDSIISGIDFGFGNSAIGIQLYNGEDTFGPITITGCTFEATENSQMAIYVNYDPTKVEISNCTFNGTYGEATITSTLYAGSETSLEISNCGTVDLKFWHAQAANFDLTLGENLIIDNTTVGEITFGPTNQYKTTFIISEGRSFNGTLNIDGKTIINLNKGGEFTGTINAPGDNVLTGSFAAAADDEDGVNIIGGSITINGTIVASSGSYSGVDVTVSGSNITVSGKLDAGVEMVIREGSVVTIPLSSELVIDNGSKLTLENGDDGTEKAEITVNGTLTIKGEIQNDGKVEINGTVNGTITNSGDVSIGSTATTSGLTIKGEGGVETSSSTNVPFVSDGTKIVVNNRAYTASTVTVSGGYKILIGAENIEYDAEKHEGASNINIVVLAASSNGTVLDLGTATIVFKEITVYEDRNNAVAGNDDYGKCEDVGQYYVRFDGSLSMSWTTVINGSNDVTERLNTIIKGVVGFDIVPMVVESVTIEGTDMDSGSPKIPAQDYTGEKIIPVFGKDYTVKVMTPDGRIIVLTQDDFTADSTGNNIGPTSDSSLANLVVTLKGNFIGSQTETFTIVQVIVDLEITNGKDTYHVGEKLDTTAITVKGVYQDTTTIDYDDDDYTIDVEYFDTEGVATITVSVINGLTKTFTVSVVGIESVTVTGYEEEYDVNDSLILEDTVVTVIYDDGLKFTIKYTDTGIETTLKDSEGGDVIGRIFSKEVTFSPTEFKDKVGNVTVTADYYGEKYEFTVFVNGFAIMYFIGEDIVTTQIGEKDDFAAVYNYVWGNSDNFIAWEVEDFGTLYAPGDMICYGENVDMWKNNTLNLHAVFVGSPVFIEQIGAGFVEDSEEASEIMEGLGSTYDGGVSDRTMFIVYQQSGFVGSQMKGYLFFNNEIVNSEDLNDADGIRTWLFSDADNTVPGLKIVDGLYEFVITADDVPVMTSSIYVKGTEPVIVHTVSFVNGTDVKSETFVEGSFVAEPAEPTKDGYNFQYWALNGVKYEFNTPVTQDIVLVAVFKEIVPGVVYSTDFIINVHYDVNERLVISLQSLDGGVIPAGTVTFSGSYAVMEEVLPGLVLPVPRDYTDSIHFDEGETFKVISADDADYIVGMISIEAGYVSDDSTITENANFMTFNFVAPANEE